jgi:N-acetylmuramoyl-L-alanine amidase
MAYDRIVISSGHGKYVRGASGILDEVDEARKVVERVADELRARGVEVTTYHDDVSTTQNENLNRIVDFHNAQPPHDLDVSLHFNAFEPVTTPRGVEVLYVTQAQLAEDVADAIASVGFINRGPKFRDDLFFLQETSEPAILIETCFVDSVADADIYGSQFGEICANIANVLGGIDEDLPDWPDRPERPERPPPESSDTITGKCSWFGGPADQGVSPSEGLAFIYDITEENQFLFLPLQPSGTSGLARRLNPRVAYCAMRFDYEKHPKDTLLAKTVLVRNIKTGIALKCTPADWGPHEDTGRLIDLSPAMFDNLELQTDNEVEVTFPYEEG